MKEVLDLALAVTAVVAVGCGLVVAAACLFPDLFDEEEEEWEP